MPQPKIPDYWRNYVKRVLTRHDGKISDRRISQLLNVEAARLREDPDSEIRALADLFPSERTVGRIRKEEWSGMKEEDKARYRDFYWPESMENRDLPWEAAPYALEYLRNHVLDTKRSNARAYAYRDVSRPTVEAIRWFWKVSVTAPTAPIELRRQITTYFSWVRFDRPLAEIFEWFLAHRPWESEDLKAGYLEFLDLTIEGTGENTTIPRLLRRAYAAGLDADIYYRLLLGIADSVEEEALKDEYFEITIDIRKNERLIPLLASTSDRAKQEEIEKEFWKIVEEERNERANQTEV